MVEYVAIPSPWQQYALVTFTDALVAKKLYGKTHTIRGVKVLTKAGRIREEHKYYECVGKEVNKSTSIHF